MLFSVIGAFVIGGVFLLRSFHLVWFRGRDLWPIAFLLVGGFLVTQLAGLVRRVGRVLAWSGLIAKSSEADRLDTNLRLFYRQRWRRFLLSITCHLCGWILGVLEVVVMLFVLDIPAGTGTAAVISPVGELAYKGKRMVINGGTIGPTTQRLYDAIVGIQYASAPDTRGWTVEV